MAAVQAELFGDDDKQVIRLTYTWAMAELIKTIPGAKPKPGGKQIADAPVSWHVWLALHTTFGNIDDPLEVGPKLQEWANDQWMTKIGVLHQLLFDQSLVE